MRDSSFPIEGMKFKDVHKRVRRIKKSLDSDAKTDKAMQSNLINSLANQAALHEGEGARTELKKELYRDSNNHSSSRCGWSKSYAEAWDRIYGKKK